MASNKLWNTGIDNQGALLTAGQVDPHWQLIQIGMNPLIPPKEVYVLANPPGSYFPPQNSGWVWANAMGQAASNTDFVFQTSFYVEVDLSQNWIQITGQWGADNFGHLEIDAHALPSGSFSGEISLPSGQQGANFGNVHPFSISPTHVSSSNQLLLNVGWHTLEVWVRNEGPLSKLNPAAFNLSAAIVVHHIPVLVGPAQHPVP